MNERKIDLIQYGEAYGPPKILETDYGKLKNDGNLLLSMKFPYERDVPGRPHQREFAQVWLRSGSRRFMF